MLDPYLEAPQIAPSPVRIIDIPTRRVRRPGDLVMMLASLAGIAGVLVLGVYTSRTTSAVMEDLEASPLQGVVDVLSNILLLPINVIEGWLTLILPMVVIAERLIRRNPRAVLEAVAAAVVAALLAAATAWMIRTVGGEALQDTVQVWQRDLDGRVRLVIAVTPALAALSALLTATGTRDRSRIVSYSWTLVWIVLVVAVLTRTSTVVGALVSVLIGRAVGLGMRYLSGVLSERAGGADLVAALRRAGVQPVSVVRIAGPSDVAHMEVETVHGAAPLGYTTSETMPAPRRVDPEPTIAPGAGGPPTTELAAREAPTDSAVLGIAATTPDSATVTVERDGLNRVYAVIDDDGSRWDAVVLDRDRQVIGLLSWLWSAVRLRGFGRRNAVSLRQAADRAVMMTYAATAAGVNSPHLRGISRARESIVLLGEHVAGADDLAGHTVDQITDAVIDDAWRQLDLAHRAGLSHRNLSAETVLLIASGPRSGEVLIRGWEQGDIASSTVSRRIDQVQLLMCFAVRVGPDRAYAAAARVLGGENLTVLAPLLQAVALPPLTQAESRRDRTVMRKLREELVSHLPETQNTVQPFQLTRFNARTVIPVMIALIAGWILLTTLNFREILTYAANAEPWWLVAAFVFGTLTFIGAAMGLIAFSPLKLGMVRTTAVQVAASMVALVAPAGVGPAALNLRFMQKRGLDTPMAVATVALLQLSQVVTTVVLLVTIALLTGSQGALATLPSGAIVTILVVALIVVGVLFAIPRVRRWALAKTVPTIRQVWPRLVWLLGQPGRLALGIGGNLMMTIGYLAAFGATLAAFNYTLPATTLAVVYLTSNAVGAAVPTPGGIGAVETALTTGLGAAGVATAAALSTAVMFRVLTFWIRVPMGWVALRYLQRKNAL